MCVRTDHPHPWRVEYWRRCPEWHEKSMPYVVDAGGVTIFEMFQHVGHPGKYDEVADRTAHLIVDAANGKEGGLVGETKYSLDDVADIVRSEGIGSAIECHTGADEIADPELRAAWAEAERAIKAVRDLLPADEEDE